MLPAAAPVVTVDTDYGGMLTDFGARIADYKRHHVKVRITGECDSSCTLLVQLDRRHLCVGPAAKLKFHQAYLPNRFNPLDTTIRSEDGVRFMMAAYPVPVKAWIAEHGGLSADLITLEGPELQAMFRRCR